MRVSVIGAGDIEKIYTYSGMDEEKVRNLIDDVGKLLAEKGVEVVILPDRGIPVLVAEAYRKHGGKKILGLIPKDDTRYGIKHLGDYAGRIDSEQNIGTWYDLNGEIAASGDVCICIGYSCGVSTEICFLKYHYKYFNSKTKIVVFRNTLSQPLHKEVEADLKNIVYIDSVEELAQILGKDL
jgi:hypothetical protein